jgi:outer membrane protein TolC
MKWFAVCFALLAGCVSGPKDWEYKWLAEPQTYNPPPKVVEKANRERPNEIAIQGRCPIDLETTLRLAGSNNLNIALAREALHSAYAKAVLEQQRFLPTLGPGYRFWRLEGSTQATLGEFVETDKQNSLLGAGLSIRWPLGDSIFSSLAAMRNYEATRALLAVTEQVVISSAVLAYLDLLREDQRVSILIEAVKISDKLVKETEVAVKAGKGFKGDQLRSQAQKLHNQLALLQAKEALKQASIRLGSILRLDPRIELFPADARALPLKFVDDEKIESLVQRAFQQRPEITEAKKRLEGAREEQRSAHWGVFIPEFQADWSSGRFGSVFSNLDGQNTYQLMLSWKIGPGGILDAGRMELADAKVMSAEISLAKVKQQVEEEVRSSYSRVLSLKEQIKLATQEIQDAEEALKLNQERQTVGLGIPLEVIQAEESVTRAKLDYLAAVIEFSQAQFQLLVRTSGFKPK